MKGNKQRFESPESASPIVTRSVAAGLRNEYCDLYQFPSWQQFVLSKIGHLPQQVSRFLISRSESFNGLKHADILNLSIKQLIDERLEDYQSIPGPFPCIFIGSALGGASAHLSLAAGGPFLPQAFVLTIRGGSFDGNIQTYFKRSEHYAQDFAKRNSGVLTIQHFDPVHDEWMTRFVNHLRFKLLKLPKEYADFVIKNLSPGGTVCYLNCSANWLRYRVAENSVFQIGGWGDLSPEEYITGSERLTNYGIRSGIKYHSWNLPGFELEEGPESEWGSEPGLAEELVDFCHSHGYQFVEIRLPEPHDFSILAFRAVRLLLEKSSLAPSGVLIEMFSQFDPTAVIKGSLLPLWLVFNTLDSLKFLIKTRPEFPSDTPIFFSPLATFTQTPDLTPFSAWEDALKDLPWRNIGARATHYPADSKTLVNWTQPLRTWVEQNPQPIHGRLTCDELLTLADEIIQQTTF